MKFAELERGDVVIDTIKGSLGRAWLVLFVRSIGDHKVEIDWLNLDNAETLTSKSSEQDDAIGEGFSVLRGEREIHR